MGTVYDRVVYPNAPFALTQPNRMAVAPALFGLAYAPPDRARVLEVACGYGGNIIPMAAAWPEAEFFGFDLAADCIDKGRGRIAALGLSNIRLEALDLMAAGDIGEFDYVIAHGLYAWVPEAVRDGLMALLGRVLSPTGVAFVSYNTLPGCRVRQAMRDVLLVCLEGVEEPEARIAATQSLLALLVESYDPKRSAFEGAVRVFAERLLKNPSEVTFHDELADVYAPHLFRDFAAHAGAHGLQFLCEAEPDRIEPKVYKTPAGEALMAAAAGDVLRTEQYVDVLHLTSFRQSLLCRAGRPIERRLDPARLAALHIAADLRPGDEGGHRGPKGAEIKAADAGLDAVLTRLGRIWPDTLPLAEVDESLYPALLNLHLARPAQLYAVPRVQGPPGERPRLWKVAREQLQAGEAELTTRLHNQFAVGDPAGRRFLSLLDGTRARPELAETMGHETGVASSEAAVDEQLAHLSRAGLLEA